jgi:hypothetical protein
VAVELTRRRRPYARSLRSELVERIAELVLEGLAWPTTEPAGGSGELEAEWPETGMLSSLGYRVGASGLQRPERQEILDCAYQGKLPRVNSPVYVEAWGRPRTAVRLQKLAESLAAFTRNAKRRRAADTWETIEDWEMDLGYLKRKYYVGRYDFGWPATGAQL